jgi:Lactate racemase N-terminal domain
MSANQPIPLGRLQFLERTSPGMPRLEHLEDQVRQELSALHLPPEQIRGRRIAVTAGSRGIANLKEILRAACGWLSEGGARPFIVAAMGSHGGATAEGQREVLASYGVTAEEVGAEVRTEMDSVSVGRTPEGVEVFMDSNAWRADGVLVVNRLKPHTSFSGKIESGLLKMIAVGLGKRPGAEETHRWGRKLGFERVIRSMAAVALESGKILAGLAVVENEFHQVAALRGARPQEIAAREEETLVLARRLVPRLPFVHLDLLVVDEMGKNLSGTGMDTKVIGRGVEVLPGEAPEIRLIYVRDLTPQSAGNAMGVGLADVIPDSLFRKINFEKTYINARTSLNPPMARVPMHLPGDREALDFALGALGSPGADEQRVIWIRNTLSLNRLAVSASLARQAEALSGWHLGALAPEARFDAQGRLASPWT